MTPTFILTLSLKPSIEDFYCLQKRFSVAVHIYNVMVKEARRRLNKYYKSKAHKEVFRHRCKEKKLTQQETESLNLARQEAGLSEYSFHKYITAQSRMYHKLIDSMTIQKLASAVWISTQKCIFSNGKQIHFKPDRFLHSVEGKTNDSGIRYKDKTLLWIGLKIPMSLS